MRKRKVSLWVKRAELDSLRKGRQRAHEALQESVELYQTLVEISPQPIVLLNLKGKIIAVNQQAVKLSGYGIAKKLVGKNGFNLIKSGDRARARKNLMLTVKNGILRDMEYTLLRADGTPITAEISSSVVKDTQGSPLAVLVVLKDVSERRAWEEQLKENELRFRTVTEGAISGVYIIDNYKFTYMNPAAAKIFGYKPEEIIGKLGPLELTYPPDRSLVTRQMQLRLKGNLDAVQYSFRGMRKDGAVVYCDSLGRAIKMYGRKIIMGTLLDVTARKKMLEELHYRVDFEKLISSLSTKFINLRAEEIDKGINTALQIIGEFAGVDRSYIFILRDKGRKMDNLYEWCAPRIPPQRERLQDLDTGAFAWAMGKLKKGQTMYVPCVAKLTAKAKVEKEEWTLEKIKSLINVPMVYQGAVIGFLGFDSVREEKVWSEDIRLLLRIIGELFANTIARKQMDKNIEKLNKELVKTNLKLKQLVLRDVHTGLYNHHYFAEAIEAEFTRAKRSGEPLSVIMIDLDYFKSVNDVYGHHFGDIVLKQLANLLTKMVRKYDKIIRYGGEEFVIITPGANRDIALILARRLWEVIKVHNFGERRHKVRLKLSVAVASFPEDNINRSADFIKIADEILNRLKDTGGDSVHSYLDIKKKLQETESDEDIALLKEKLEKLTKRANQSLAESIFAFAKTIEIKDHYTGKHVEKTVHYATEIAKKFNLPKDEIERIREAAVLHDLGKIGISEKTLLKKTKLTKKEYDEIKKHPQIGADILRPIHFFNKIIPFILYHHEHWDGRGYPYGLKGEEIPLGARIIAVADTYEALTSNRRYRQGCSKQQAIKKMKKAAGTQLDAKVVNVLIDVLTVEK
ncbi:MAG: diguanylate cyclase [Candidatus Omnitrophota bacterium]